VRESVVSVVVRVAPPRGSPPAITAGGMPSGRRWADWPFGLFGQREGKGVWAIVWLLGRPSKEKRRSPSFSCLFLKNLFKY
jgi:hypothetical protein